jgi:DNA polymerase III delta prime subunit
MQLLIHKYKPRQFDQFGLKNEELLRSILRTDQYNIMFHGSSSKTSLLNTFVNEYYGETVDCSKNVISINHLKEHGIGYYRNELKTFCQSRSNVLGKRKIVILDDIDAIHENNQQVIRNCMDKYSSNVMFIASCANITRVIESIQSRFVIVNITRPDKGHISKLISHIIANEQLTVDADACDFIVQLADGDIKQILNYLEKFKLFNERITIDVATSLCTNINFNVFVLYFQHVKSSNLCNAIHILYELHDQGYSVIDILDSLFAFIKHTDVLSNEDKYKIVPFICKYITIFHEIHENELELALMTNNLCALGLATE